MVDFQSRDTRRGTSDEESEEATEASETETEEVSEQPEESGDDGAETPPEEDVEDRPDAFTYAVVTVSDERTLEDDVTGDTVVEAVERAGDAVVTRELVLASYDGIQTTLATLAGRRDVDTVVTVGGTGVEPDDVTVDAAIDLFDKRLPGFGELFRVLSHDHEGTAVVRTRATAGIIADVPVFCLPGDSAAARRGVEQIVLAEAPELAARATEETAEDEGE